MPKREIFNRPDFYDFYTTKSLRVGDFGVKIKKIVQIFRGAKFHTRMLSLFLRIFFSKLGQNFFLSVELLRSLVSVNNDFSKFLFF